MNIHAKQANEKKGIIFSTESMMHHDYAIHLVIATRYTSTYENTFS